jgi:glyoxylase-like metal-dependent hydrolase (beta-lactamase superfamily II)
MAAPDFPAGLHVFERGWLSANNILFTGGDNTLLVDSGYCTHSAQTLSLIESVLGSRPLDMLVNSHLHSDHCGGNAALQARYAELRTLIPPGHSKEVADWDPVALTYLPTGQLCPQFSFTDTLQPGQLVSFGLEMWEVHAAPGHDPHSLVFFEPRSRLLISADALWENGFGVVFPELEGANAFVEVAATLDLIEQLNPETVIPGHGRVFTYEPEVMARARRRLDSFVSNPLKHAHHAAKVLLKFKLLETQRQNFDDFAKWAIETPYFMQIRGKFFPDIPVRAWIELLSDELVAAGVARREGVQIANA